MKNSRSLRFCLVTTFYPPFSFGGDAIFVQRLAFELADRGHSVEVVHCLDSYRALAGRIPEGSCEEHPGVKVHSLESRFGFLSPLATQQTGYPFFKSGEIRRILDSGFDVIHFHNISLVGGPGILEMGRAVKLYTAHEHWLVCPMHILFKFNRRVCDRKNCLFCSLVHRRPPQFWRYTGMLEEAAGHIDCFISPSLFSIRKHHELGFAFPIVHIPHFSVPGGSPLEFSVEHHSLGDPYFLFVGRLEKLKGLQTVIPLFLEHPGARLVIAGKGRYEARLRQMAGGSPDIVFLGFKSGAELAGLYRGAVALIVPSECYDVYPQVVMESMQNGTPVIARNIGGLSEAIDSSGGGLVYETPEELRSLIGRLLEDRPLRNRLASNARMNSAFLWSAETHIARYLQLIDEVMEAKAREAAGIS